VDDPAPHVSEPTGGAGARPPGGGGVVHPAPVGRVVTLREGGYGQGTTVIVPLNPLLLW
jgi:hypothetical protein